MDLPFASADLLCAFFAVPVVETGLDVVFAAVFDAVCVFAVFVLVAGFFAAVVFVAVVAAIPAKVQTIASQAAVRKNFIWANKKEGDV